MQWQLTVTVEEPTAVLRVLARRRLGRIPTSENRKALREACEFLREEFFNPRDGEKPDRICLTLDLVD